MPKTGARRVVVDGVAFRWRVRSRPTYCQINAWTPLTVSVERNTGGGVLVLVFPGARPDNWIGEEISIATPASVASAIRSAVNAGWTVEGAGGPTFFDVASRRLGPSMRSVSANPEGSVTAS